MRHMCIMNYWTGKTRKVKLNAKAQGVSISYQVEGDCIVVRDYRTGDRLQSIKVEGSVQFWCEEA